MPCLCCVCLQQSESVVKEACSEFEVACSEVNLQQQLEELESLVLQRGLLGDTNRYVMDLPTASVRLLPSSRHVMQYLRHNSILPRQLMACRCVLLTSTKLRFLAGFDKQLRHVPCADAVLMSHQPCQQQWRQQHAWLPSVLRSSSCFRRCRR